MPPNLRAIVAQIRHRWGSLSRASSAAGQVSVHVKDPPATGGLRVTTIRVAEHSIPDLRTRKRGAALVVTQKPQYLAPWVFDERVVARLERASVAKGRRLYCYDTRRDVTDPVLAALSFHVDRDESLPLQVTAIALRLHDADAVAQSHVAAWYLTQYVQAAAAKLDRPQFIEFWTTDDRVARALAVLGFSEQRPARYHAVGRCYRQPPD